MAKLNVLSDDDITVMREMTAWFRRSSLNTPQRPYRPDPPAMAPEVYVAFIGSTGIAGLTFYDTFSGTGTGTASGETSTPIVDGVECTLYRLQDQGGYFTLEETDLVRTVYNYGTSAVEAFSYVKVERDKWGTWWVDHYPVDPIYSGLDQGPGWVPGSRTVDGATSMDALLADGQWHYLPQSSGLGGSPGVSRFPLQYDSGESPGGFGGTDGLTTDGIAVYCGGPTEYAAITQDGISKRNGITSFGADLDWDLYGAGFSTTNELFEFSINTASGYATTFLMSDIGPNTALFTVDSPLGAGYYGVGFNLGGTPTLRTGVYGSLADGSEVSGGIITDIGGGSSSSIAVGTTPVSGGSTGDLLSTDGSTVTATSPDSLAVTGDLSGTLGAAVVTALQGSAVSATPPNDGDVLVWDAGSAQWIPTAGGGGGYTDENAQDAVGSALADTTTINLTYDDVTPAITADVVAGSIGPTQLASTTVTPGTYALMTATVDGDGRLTAAADGSTADLLALLAAAGGITGNF